MSESFYSSIDILGIVDKFSFIRKAHRSFTEHTLMASAKQSFKPSIVRVKKFDELLWTLRSSVNFAFSSPRRNDSPLASDPPTTTFWFHQVKVGLLFPICHFLAKLFMLYSIPPNQLYASSIRKTLFFHIILREYEIFDTSHILFLTHDAFVLGMFYYFMENHISLVHLYSKDTSLDKNMLN